MAQPVLLLRVKKIVLIYEKKMQEITVLIIMTAHRYRFFEYDLSINQST